MRLSLLNPILKVVSTESFVEIMGNIDLKYKRIQYGLSITLVSYAILLILKKRYYLTNSTNITVAVCDETINYIPHNGTSEGYAALNTSLLSSRTCFRCHYPNGSQIINNHYVRVGSPSSFVQIFANNSLSEFLYERGFIEVNTNTIGVGLMNSLWINCLSLSFLSYSPTIRVTLASKQTYIMGSNFV